jgi:RNA polymerase sigma factor (sigma-70 family)
VQRAIQQLSKREFEIIRMKFFENKSYEEIALLTTATPRTIYNHVYNALKVLRKSLNILLFYPRFWL